MKTNKNSHLLKINLDEKKKQNLYAICVVLALILLMCGDRIVIHFIDQVPNDNNKVFGSDMPADYIIDFLDELSIEEVLNKVENKESFTLISSRNSCHTCTLYIPILKEMFAKYEIKAYYINRSLYDRDNENFVKFMSLDERLNKNLQYTPYVMTFKDGVLVDELKKKKKRNEVEEFVLRNNLEANKI